MSGAGGSSLLARIRRGGFREALQAVTSGAAGRRAKIYLVGGCVRDLMLGRSLADLDLVVEGDPAAIAGEAARRLRGSATGPSPFGTWKVEAPGGLRIDLAMARRETYAAPAALPRVSPAPIEKDLLRRDFTVNAMALALTGPRRSEILDPSGGAGDLQRRRLRLLHGRSLADDPTRAFRAARYAARYSFRVGREWPAAMAAADARGAFRRLTPARLRRELELAWEEARPEEVLSRSARLGLLRRIDHAMAWTTGLRRALARAAEDRAGPSRSAREIFFAILLRGAPRRARPRVLSRLGLTGRPARRILEAAQAPERAARMVGGRAGRPGRVMEELSRWDPVSIACATAAAPGSVRRRLIRLASAWERARPVLSGEDLLSLGVPRGPRVGEVLRRIRAERAAGRIRTRRDEETLARSLGAPGRS